MLIPSIDIMGGKAVQLRQGKERVLERQDVLDLAKDFSKYGEIAVIDLDAALGKGENIGIIKEILKIADCRVGGGIRTIDKAEELLAAGAKKIIIGTNTNPDFLKQLPKERVIIAIDVKKGFVVNKGWTESTGRNPEEAIKKLERYCSEFLFTDVDVEGTMQGICIEKIKSICSATRNKVTIAGGIKSIEDIRNIESIGCNSQLGMSIYTGKIALKDAFVSLLKLNEKGLIPTIAQDEDKNVLMLAYSSKESLMKAFETGKATYFSRSRNILWTKGETSGNFQELLKARYDCDKDAILFTVKQKGFACHQGDYTCFGDKPFSMDRLYSRIKERADNPRKGSYTSLICREEKMIMEKIREESDEVINYRDRSNLVWEIADLQYFLLVLMAKKGITMKEVYDELWRRER